MAKKTNFFTHDSNARNDEKVIRLRMKHGAAGYGVYFMLLERLRDEADYSIAADYDMLAFDFHVEPALVQSVVENFGLFEFTSDSKFFSDSFMERMQTMDEKSSKLSEAGKKGNLKRWGLSPGDCQATENPSGGDCQAIANITDNTKHTKQNKKEKEEEKSENPFIPMLLQNDEWKQIICMRYHKKPEEIPKLIEDFNLDCLCRGKVHLSLQDAQSHFANWLTIQISEQQKQENYGTNNKRRPNKKVADSAEDFSQSF